MTVGTENKQESQENTISPVPDVASSQGAIEPDQIASGAAGTGQENEELEWMKRQEEPAFPPEEQAAGWQDDTPAAQSIGSGAPAPRLARRVTALRGQEINSGQRPKRSIRSQTERDLLAYDSDVPYTAVEKAQLNLVCSLIERQDRVTEQLLLMINDLQYRTDELELTMDELVQKKTGTVERMPAGSRKERGVR